MAKNANLIRASKVKHDEFYTQIADIEREMKHYISHFKDKVIFCNCDDPEYSNFWRFFQLNFYRLGLKKLISTHYEENKPSYKMEIVSTNTDNGQDGVQIGIPDYVKTPLRQNGDFRSPECIEILKEADIVITNPPFSLFKEYISLLMEYDKKFIVIGSKNAITYKEIFQYLQDNKMWLGYGFKAGNAYFAIPENEVPNYSKDVYNPETGLVKFRNCCWYSNLDISKRHEDLILVKKYNEKDYPRYANYDAIEVGKVADIPCDYYGNMGVPITFLDVYNPEQFEIVGSSRWLGRPMSEIAPKGTYVSGGIRFYLLDNNEDIKDNQLSSAQLSSDTAVCMTGLSSSVRYNRLYDRIVIRRRIKDNEN